MKVYSFSYRNKQIGESFLSKEIAMKNCKRIWKNFLLECLDEWNPKVDGSNDVALVCVGDYYIKLRVTEIDDDLISNYQNKDKQDAQMDVIQKED